MALIPCTELNAARDKLAQHLWANRDRAFLRKLAENAEDPDGAPATAEQDADKWERRLKQLKSRQGRKPYSGKKVRLKFAQLMKTADVGPSPHKQFDEAFATMAYTYLREKVPALIDHMLGFQVIDRTEDGRRALGAFVFDVGGKIIEAPTFFIDGELKGNQFLRLRDENIFIPMRDTVVNMILQQPRRALGDAVPLPNGTAVQNPDMAPFRETPLQLGVPG